jgi:hypothetical protein
MLLKSYIRVVWNALLVQKLQHCSCGNGGSGGSGAALVCPCAFLFVRTCCNSGSAVLYCSWCRAVATIGLISCCIAVATASWLPCTQEKQLTEGGLVMQEDCLQSWVQAGRLKSPYVHPQI